MTNLKLIGIVFLFSLINCTDIKSKKNRLEVTKITVKDSLGFKSVSEVLENSSPLIKISWVGWDEFPYKPDVNFRIAHDDSLLFLKYYVKENHVLAKNINPNSAVHRDSCVEFFVDPDQSGNYYNFEFINLIII